MTKAEALYGFFSSFDIPAYAATAVPDDAVFPWLTYEPIFDLWDGDGGGNVSITVNLWYYGSSEKPANDKAAELSKAIGYGGKLLPCDGGYIWLHCGSPWCQNLSDDTDKQIKRRYLNVTADYLTL